MLTRNSQLRNFRILAQLNLYQQLDAEVTRIDHEAGVAVPATFDTPQCYRPMIGAWTKMRAMC